MSIGHSYGKLAVAAGILLACSTLPVYAAETDANGLGALYFGSSDVVPCELRTHRIGSSPTSSSFVHPAPSCVTEDWPSAASRVRSPFETSATLADGLLRCRFCRRRGLPRAAPEARVIACLAIRKPCPSSAPSSTGGWPLGHPSSMRMIPSSTGYGMATISGPITASERSGSAPRWLRPGPMVSWTGAAVGAPAQQSIDLGLRRSPVRVYSRVPRLFQICRGQSSRTPAAGP